MNPNEYNNNYDYSNPNSYMDLNSGYESGNPVVQNLNDFKSLMYEEVISKSFLFMIVGLLITAFAAFTTTPEVGIRLLTGSGYWILLVSELAIVLVSNWALSKNNAILAGILFVIYSYLTGMIFAPLFIVYTSTSLVSVFLITAATFAVMAVYGLVTKKDLSSVGSICLMGLIGLILVSVVNLVFLRSSTFDLIVSGVGVLIFVGLTAYDAQKIKKMVEFSDDSNVLSLALFGAFELYLDFINLFLRLLRILGKSRD